MKYSDQEIISKLKANQTEVFKQLFEENFFNLYRLAFNYLSNKEIAEEIVQDVFIYIWNNRHHLLINSSLKAYLRTAVKNKSINYIKSKYSRIKLVSIEKIKASDKVYHDHINLETKELDQLIREAINTLPPKCKIVFNLSRNANMTYQEIADELGISKETVKSQMGISLSKIRHYLRKFWDDIPS